MKTTRYFREIVIKKRSYIKIEWIEKILNDPIKTEIQPTGRIRYWGYIEELQKYVRVITLADRETVHNVFPDRNFKE
ncbi:MAG: hypothetical protein HXY48_00130 [Ignavibacteriaceae bacterium]|jgi:hypothetical protein|nr:hypothetical protein [Ignavibacteriaceae bacterium]